MLTGTSGLPSGAGGALSGAAGAGGVAGEFPGAAGAGGAAGGCTAPAACEYVAPSCIPLAGTSGATLPVEPPEVGSACSNGVGACARVGEWMQASDGTLSCNAIAAEPSAEVCNGIDDDCNGAADDGLSPSLSAVSVLLESFLETGLVKATRGDAITGCGFPGNSITRDTIDCADLSGPDLGSRTQLITHDSQIHRFDFTFDPEGRPVFCFTDSPVVGSYNLHVAYFAAELNSYQTVQIAADSYIDCDIELDAAGVLQVTHSDPGSESSFKLSFDSHCDEAEAYAPIESNLEALPPMFYDPDPRFDLPEYSVATTYIWYADSKDVPSVVMRMAPWMLPELLYTIPGSTDYRYYDPGLVILPDGRRLVTVTETYTSPSLMCGNDCSRVGIRLIRAEPFSDLLVPASTSSIILDKYGIAGGLIRSSSGALQQLFLGEGGVSRLFICG